MLPVRVIYIVIRVIVAVLVVGIARPVAVLFPIVSFAVFIL